MKIENLPEAVLTYLWKWEYNPKWAEEGKLRNLREELSNFGYEITDDDYIEGEYCDLRGYMGFHVKKV